MITIYHNLSWIHAHLQISSNFYDISLLTLALIFPRPWPILRCIASRCPAQLHPAFGDNHHGISWGTFSQQNSARHHQYLSDAFLAATVDIIQELLESRLDLFQGEWRWNSGYILIFEGRISCQRSQAEVRIQWRRLFECLQLIKYVLHGLRLPQDWQRFINTSQHYSRVDSQWKGCCSLGSTSSGL